MFFKIRICVCIQAVNLDRLKHGEYLYNYTKLLGLRKMKDFEKEKFADFIISVSHKFPFSRIRLFLKAVSGTFFPSLFYMSPKESNFETRKSAFFHLKSSFGFWDNQILIFRVCKCHDVIKCLSMKGGAHIIEWAGK